MSKENQVKVELIGRAISKLLERRRRGSISLSTVVKQQQDPSIQQLEDGSVVSTKHRIQSHVPDLAAFKPINQQVFSPNGLPNIDFVKQHFKSQGKLTDIQVVRILNQAIDLIEEEQNLINVVSPVTLVGDIHGQYYDFMTLFEKNGDPSNTNPYLFLGDYVDRGYFSIECLLLLYCYKINYPQNVHILRGNHESKHLTNYFTFKKECLHKYSQRIYKLCCESFNTLPLAAVLDNRYFCCHGGISPDLVYLEDLQKIDRFMDPPSSGLMCDILWSDPIDDYDTYSDLDHVDSDLDSDCDSDFDMKEDDTLFIPNSERGCSYAFTYKAVCLFLKRNNLIGVIRAHQAQAQGFRLYKHTKGGCPSIITLFSAPNYIDRYHNKAAYLRYDNNVMDIKQFGSVPHPYWLPDFKDVFSWSLPFVGENITNILLAILNICVTQEDYEDIEGMSLEEINEMRSKERILQTKIMSIGRVSRLYQVLQEESANIDILKTNYGGVLPKGILLGGSESIKQQVDNFEDIKAIDKRNEALPPTGAELLKIEEQREKVLLEIIDSEPESNDVYMSDA